MKQEVKINTPCAKLCEVLCLSRPSPSETCPPLSSSCPAGWQPAETLTRSPRELHTWTLQNRNTPEVSVLWSFTLTPPCYSHCFPNTQKCGANPVTEQPGGEWWIDFAQSEVQKRCYQTYNRGRCIQLPTIIILEYSWHGPISSTSGMMSVGWSIRDDCLLYKV